jgi:hypothetical protein
LESGIDDTRNIARVAVQMLADGCSMPLNDGIAAEHAVEWRAFPAGKKGRASAKGAPAARASSPAPAPAAAATESSALPGTPPLRVPARAKGSTRKERSELRTAARAALRPDDRRASTDEAPPSMRKGLIPSAAALESLFSK